MSTGRRAAAEPRADLRLVSGQTRRVFTETRLKLDRNSVRQNSREGRDAPSRSPDSERARCVGVATVLPDELAVNCRPQG